MKWLLMPWGIVWDTDWGEYPWPCHLITSEGKVQMKSFYEWLMQQRDRDDVVGDVANEAARDPDFPKGWTNYDRIRSYIYAKTKDSDVLQAVAEAWAEYAPNDDISDYDYTDDEDDDDER